MKKAYTFIELLIVISIIALMAVVAIPSFSNYGKKAELDNKAEEIKYLIEKAYADAVSPAIGLNGSMVEFATGPSSEVRVKRGVFSDECKKDINDDNCAFTYNNSNINLIEIGRNDNLKGVTIGSITIKEMVNGRLSLSQISPVGISFVTPADTDSVYMCNSRANNNKIIDYNGVQGIDCNLLRVQMVIRLASEVGARDITINRNPFSVKIAKSN